jgi:hypothetical protein
MSSSASDADASSGHASSDPDFASDGEPAALEEIQETAAKRKRVKRKAKPRVKRKANAQPAAAVPAEKRLNPVDIENMLIADIQPQQTAMFAMEQGVSKRRKFAHAAPAGLSKPEPPIPSEPSAPEATPYTGKKLR